MTSIPFLGLDRRSPAVLGKLRELLFPVCHSVFIDTRGSEARGGTHAKQHRDKARVPFEKSKYSTHKGSKSLHQDRRITLARGPLCAHHQTAYFYIARGHMLVVVCRPYIVPYLVTFAEGLAGVKAEAAPRVKKKAKRDRKGAMVKLCGISGGNCSMPPFRKGQGGCRGRVKRSALQFAHDVPLNDDLFVTCFLFRHSKLAPF